MNNKKILLYLLMTIGLILLFSVPFILKSKLFLFQNDIDSSRFGQYGSYIGGLIGSSFAGLSFFILLLTYKNQLIDTNQNRLNQDIDYINKLYEQITLDINSLSFSNFKGVEVFYQFTEKSLNETQGVLDQLNSLLASFENIISFASSTNFSSENVKRITMTRIYFLYYSKILWPVHAVIWSLREALISTYKHDDSQYIFPKYQTLSKETVKYLIDQGLISRDKLSKNDIFRD